MHEFELIHTLIPMLPRNAATIVGAGDDCAVIDLGIPGQWALFKTDAVVQDVHFTTKTPPEKIGHKALGRCLSDIAAMAGTPVSALVTLGLPRFYDPAWVSRIYAGMSELATRYETAIVGGETTTNPERVFLSISMLGKATPGKCPLRSDAKPSDAIFVTGELGGSILGKHLDFEPRIQEASWLVNHFDIHSMMDISDGLAGDLPHILRASRCGAELLASAIPISRDARTVCSSAHGRSHDHSPLSRHCDPLSSALSDGEDFELLFTVSSRDAAPLLDAWKNAFPGIRLSCIGKITGENGLRLRTKDNLTEISFHGYQHFA